jgi:hypothetical protein
MADDLEAPCGSVTSAGGRVKAGCRPQRPGRYAGARFGVQSSPRRPLPRTILMRRTGTARLALHRGKAPRWLFARMVPLARGPDRGVLGDLERLPDLVLPQHHRVHSTDINPRYVQRILLKTYERAPKDFETLLGIEGGVRRPCAHWPWWPSSSTANR